MSKRTLEFAITFKGDMSPERTVALAKRAEDLGFTYVWTFDSHVLWKDPYPMLTLLAANTQKVRLGTLVTNPGVRDWTVTASTLATMNIISGGRMDMGIGRGDSSRRVLGQRPNNVAPSLCCCRDRMNSNRTYCRGLSVQQINDFLTQRGCLMNRKRRDR